MPYMCVHTCMHWFSRHYWGKPQWASCIFKSWLVIRCPSWHRSQLQNLVLSCLLIYSWCKRYHVLYMVCLMPLHKSITMMLVVITTTTTTTASVLWRCWLGGRKGIRPVKTEWLRYWLGCLQSRRKPQWGPPNTQWCPHAHVKQIVAVTLLAWHSSCHITQPALFTATNVWRETIYLPSREWVLHFTR